MRATIVEALAPWIGQGWASLLVPGWFFFTGLAGLMVAVLITRAARRGGEDVAAVAGATLAGYVAAVAGGILLPLLYDAAGHLIRSGHLRIHWAGMVSWCGYSCGFIAIAISLRRSGTITLARFCDLAAAPLGLALAICRIGCFVAGCDYGQVTSAPWAVRFPAGSAAWRTHVNAGWVPTGRDASLPVHPTQLYEVALGLALFALALVVARTRWARERSGRLFLAVAGTYAVGRITIESMRGDAGRGLLGAVSSAQIFGALILGAIAWIAWQRRRSAAAGAVAAALALLVAISPARADAPPKSEAPKSAGQKDEQAPEKAPPATPPEEGAGEPLDPYAEPAPDTASPPATGADEPAGTTAPEGAEGQTMQAAGGAQPRAARQRRYEIGLLLGTSSPLNRRNGQVPLLAGASLSAALEVMPTLYVGLDLDQLANEVATHSSLMFGAAFRKPFTPRFGLRGRAALGITLVNFDDEAFQDVLASGLRVSTGGDYALSRNFSLLVWPLTLDFVSSPALGGPIIAYQLRIGISYRSAL